MSAETENLKAVIGKLLDRIDQVDLDLQEATGK